MMTAAFWSLVAVLTGASLFLVVRPLLRPVRGEPGNARSDAYSARLAELDSEVGAGTLSDENARLARTELERELLANVEAEQPASPAPSRAGRRLGAMVAAGMGVLAIALYLLLGRPDLLGEVSRQAGDTAEHSASIEKMVAQLAERLARQPDDAQGWEMLGRSYMVMGRFAEAARAFERQLSLEGESADALVRYAESLARAAGGQFNGKAGELVERALALDAENPGALWFSGMSAMQKGDIPAALEYWRHLLPLLQDDAESRAEVERLINLAEKRHPEFAAGESTGTASEQAERPVQATAGIRVAVDVAPGLRAALKPDATLFIVARPSGSPGMPLAVSRHTAAELPLEVTLDDSMAMSPGNRLSMHDRVDVMARTSASGTTERQSGDLIGELRNVDTHAGGKLALVLDRQVP